MVLCYGSLNPDLVHEVSRLPDPGADLSSRSWHLSHGGGAANPAVALAAWGVEVAVVGHEVGDDPLGTWLLAELSRRGVDTSPVQVTPGVPTPHCLVLLTPDGERTIVSTGYQGLAWQPIEDWSDLRLLTVDAYSGGHGAAVAEEAGRRGVPVVGIDAQAGNLLIRSRREHPSEAEARRLVAQGRMVVLTDGPRPATLFSSQGALAALPPPVQVRDPTGAGDAFAAMCALGLLEGWDPERILRMAVAVGTLLAARGRAGGIPSLAELEGPARSIPVSAPPSRWEE